MTRDVRPAQNLAEGTSVVVDPAEKRIGDKIKEAKVALVAIEQEM